MLKVRSGHNLSWQAWHGTSLWSQAAPAAVAIIRLKHMVTPHFLPHSTHPTSMCVCVCVWLLQFHAKVALGDQFLWEPRPLVPGTPRTFVRPRCSCLINTCSTNRNLIAALMFPSGLNWVIQKLKTFKGGQEHFATDVDWSFPIYGNSLEEISFKCLSLD